jgi:hypothetical protein
VVEAPLQKVAVSDPDDPIVEHFHGIPIRRSQAARATEEWNAVLERRAQAQFRPLMDQRGATAAGVNCSRCDSIGDFSDEGTRGYCSALRHMVSTWHNAECRLFVARTRMTGGELIKKIVDAGERERLADALKASKK